MIPPFIECGRRNGKQAERDIIDSLLYSAYEMRERGIAIVTEEKPKLYVMMCFNSITADTRLRQFVKKNFPWVKQSKFGAGGFKAIMHNGDEYHFVPACQFDRWMIGRQPFYVISENDVEREEKMLTTEAEKREYEKVRNKYESPFALYRKTDAEIAIEQAREIKNLKELADKANEEIKKLNEENKALIEENAKLRKESKTLTFESDGGLFNIEYQGMKFKATKVIIREGMLCNRVMEITANSVSE